MRRAVGFFVCTLGLALALLMGRGLVRGPAEPGCPLPEVPRTIALLTAAQTADPDVRTENSTESIRVRALLPAAIPLPRQVSADHNGQNVTAVSWRRAVYEACPPEGEPG